MSSIETVRAAINNQISDGRQKIKAHVQIESNNFPQKGIFLFYDDEGASLALGKFTRVGLYTQPIQIAVAHSTYEKSRQVAFSLFEFINTLKITGIVLTPLASPVYAGINLVRSQYIYTIDYNMKGDQ